MTSGGRLFSLDILRGLAACLVLVRHVPFTTLQGTSPVEPMFLWLQQVGWIGVDLFFVLSGLLISSLIYREFDRTSRFDPKRFLIRRSFKIWPAYFAAYGLAAILQWLAATYLGNVERAQSVAGNALWNAIFLQNYVKCDRWPHSWSLAVEEHFYLGLALILFTWIAFRRRALPSGSQVFQAVIGLWVAVAVMDLVLRWRVSFPVHDWKIAYYQTHLRMDALLCGVSLAYVAWYRPHLIGNWVTRPTVVFPCFALAFLWPTLWSLEHSPWMSSIGFTLIYLCFAVVVAGAAFRPEFGSSGPAPIRLLMTGLAWIGTYSYTIYLAHAVLYTIPGTAGFREWALTKVAPLIGTEGALWLDRIAFWIGSIVLGVLLSQGIERPFLRLRSRYFSDAASRGSSPPKLDAPSPRQAAEPLTV